MPVFPIGLYLRVGLDGVGWDSYEERFWEHVLLRFEFAYVGLPALDAEKFVNGEHLIGAALSSLMRVPKERRVELHAQALQRIADSGENELRRFYLAECVEAYAKLSEDDRRELDALVHNKPYEKVGPQMVTTFERGKMEGKLETLLALLKAKFGPLDPEVVRRVTVMNAERLDRLGLDILKAASLNELELQN